MKVQITITYDVVRKEINVENPDELGELEYIGLLETAKLLVVDKN
ncbi:hypothetical protein [Cytobacillus horneckiae]